MWIYYRQLLVEMMEISPREAHHFVKPSRFFLSSGQAGPDRVGDEIYQSDYHLQ